VWALRRRANNIIDRWTEGIWRRVISVEGKPVELTLTQVLGSTELQVRLYGQQPKEKTKSVAIEVLEKCLGIRKDLSEFYRIAQQDSQLSILANRFAGLKPPRFPSVFEAAVNGIACQQVSLNLCIILLNRLAAAYGASFKTGETTAHAFPRAEDLHKLQPEDFRELGFSHMKGRAIVELSKAVVSGELDLERLKSLSNDEAIERLCELRGFGRWTAQYVLLRGLGRIDVFPLDDVGGLRGLQRWQKIEKPLHFEEAKKIVSKWVPYEGLIYFHLLLNRLAEEGSIKEPEHAF
jgi:DNA-3-methyladenine glycosylase II